MTKAKPIKLADLQAQQGNYVITDLSQDYPTDDRNRRRDYGRRDGGGGDRGGGFGGPRGGDGYGQRYDENNEADVSMNWRRGGPPAAPAAERPAMTRPMERKPIAETPNADDVWRTPGPSADDSMRRKPATTSAAPPEGFVSYTFLKDRKPRGGEQADAVQPKPSEPSNTETAPTAVQEEKLTTERKVESQAQQPTAALAEREAPMEVKQPPPAPVAAAPSPVAAAPSPVAAAPSPVAAAPSPVAAAPSSQHTSGLKLYVSNRVPAPAVGPGPAVSTGITTGKSGRNIMGDEEDGSSRYAPRGSVGGGLSSSSRGMGGRPAPLFPPEVFGNKPKQSDFERPRDYDRPRDFEHRGGLDSRRFDGGSRYGEPSRGFGLDSGSRPSGSAGGLRPYEPSYSARLPLSAAKSVAAPEEPKQDKKKKKKKSMVRPVRKVEGVPVDPTIRERWLKGSVADYRNLKYNLSCWVSGSIQAGECTTEQAEELLKGLAPGFHQPAKSVWNSSMPAVCALQVVLNLLCAHAATLKVPENNSEREKLVESQLTPYCNRVMQAVAPYLRALKDLSELEHYGRLVMNDLCMLFSAFNMPRLTSSITLSELVLLSLMENCPEVINANVVLNWSDDTADESPCRLDMLVQLVHMVSWLTSNESLAEAAENEES